MNKLSHYAWMFGLALITPITALAADAHKGEGVAASPMEPIVLEMIWAVVLFSIFAGILGFVVWPKILGAIQAREQKLEGDLVGAESARKEADETLAQYKAQLADAAKEAQQKIADAAKAADQLEAKRKAEIESEVASMKERAAAEIEAAKEQAIGEMHAHMAELSTQIAAKILQREINASDQQQLVSDSLAELSKGGV